jgi:type I restriction enzyme S subunit
MSVIDGWKVCELDELAYLDVETLSASTQKDFQFYYVDISSASEGRLELPSTETQFREAPSRARKVVHRHDVLMSMVRPNLKAFAYFDHTDEPCVASTGFAVLTAKENSSAKFLLYAILSENVSRQIDGLVIGSNYPAINSSAVRSLKIHAPPKPEQTKIAEILSTVDRAIEQTEALIAKQQRLKTGLMQDLLTRGIDEHGNLRSEQTHPFKDSPLGRIPVEWEVNRLGALLSSINQGWSPDCDTDSAAHGEWGVLKTTAVLWEGYQDYENKGLPPNLSPRPHLEIQTGDLLMTRAGPNSRVGVIAYVYSTRSKLMLSDKIYRLVPTKEIDGRFLCYALSSAGSQRHLSNLKTGMAESQTNISQEIVKALLTVCPPSAEQSLIADRLDHILSESKKSTAVLSKLRSLKTALMQDLLTGRKQVTEILR